MKAADRPADQIAAAVQAIDRALSRHIVHSYVNEAVRQIAATRKDAHGNLHLSPAQVEDIVPLVAKTLDIPTWVFEDIGGYVIRFDHDGDGFLDENEVKRLFKRAMKQQRRELGGPMVSSVPFKSIEEAGYTVVKELGRGGQGSMHLCTKQTAWYLPWMKHEYCVKFYEKANANAGGLEELLDEYELMKSLDSPYTAKTYEAFQDQHFYYLVNEPYFGGDLTKLGKEAYGKNVRMSENWWRGIFKQCLLGVDYLHTQGIMHCDIKEPNIMIAKNDNYVNPQVVLIDYGLSSAFTAGRQGVCGTPGYIPPETWQTDIWYVRGDVFSMGIVFFQLMSGQVPSASGGVMGALAPTHDDDWGRAAATQPMPWNLFPNNMPQLGDLLDWMTKRNREERPKALQALKHPWFTVSTDAELPTQNLHALVGIGAGHANHEQLENQMIEKNNLDDLRTVQRKFQQADTQGNGMVDGHTAKRILTEHGVDAGVAKDCVESGAGAFPYAQLTTKAIASKEIHGYQYIRDLFDKLDVDKSGTLTTIELRGLIDGHAFDCPKDELDQLMHWMQPDRGVVTFDCFAQAMLDHGRISNRSQQGAATSMNGAATSMNGKQNYLFDLPWESTPAATQPPANGAAQPEGDFPTFGQILSGFVGGTYGNDVAPNGRSRPVEEAPQQPTGMYVRVAIMAFSIPPGLRQPGVRRNVFCTCSCPSHPEPLFDTPANNHPVEARWNLEREIDDFPIGDSLEFAMYDEGSRGESELMGVAYLSPEQFTRFGYDGELTVVAERTGICGLLRVRVDAELPQPVPAVIVADERPASGRARRRLPQRAVENDGFVDYNDYAVSPPSRHSRSYQQSPYESVYDGPEYIESPSSAVMAQDLYYEEATYGMTRQPVRIRRRGEAGFIARPQSPIIAAAPVQAHVGAVRMQSQAYSYDGGYAAAYPAPAYSYDGGYGAAYPVGYDAAYPAVGLAAAPSITVLPSVSDYVTDAMLTSPQVMSRSSLMQYPVQHAPAYRLF